MSYRLFQILFLLGFYIMNSSEWDFLFNSNKNDKLLCYSCKGIECEQITNNDKNKIICNKKTQLCWAGFIDQQPYRTCASRYCTPTDSSLDSDIHIETCCRSNLCNSVSLSSSYEKISLSHSTETTTIQTIIDDFVDEIINEKSYNINWDRLSYDKGFSIRIATISSILLFLMPLLLVLLL